MADTRVQREAARWIRDNWLPQCYGQRFEQRRYALTAGGEFAFDAISEDGQVVATISTSSALTAGGRSGAGKLQKIRADVLFLLLSEAKIQVLVFTERDMLDLCRKEQQNGRLPQSLQFLGVELPGELRERLQEARESSSDEVSPSRTK